MDFLAVFLRGVSLLPSIVQGVETMYGAQTGAQKRHAAVELVGAALSVADCVGGRPIVDPEKFTAALGTVVDGIVDCLNASIWAKAGAGDAA